MIVSEVLELYNRLSAQNKSIVARLEKEGHSPVEARKLLKRAVMETLKELDQDLFGLRLRSGTDHDGPSL